jgi:hypothetical protein
MMLNLLDDLQLDNLARALEGTDDSVEEGLRCLGLDPDDFNIEAALFALYDAGLGVCCECCVWVPTDQLVEGYCAECRGVEPEDDE